MRNKHGEIVKTIHGNYSAAENVFILCGFAYQKSAFFLVNQLIQVLFKE